MPQENDSYCNKGLFRDDSLSAIRLDEDRWRRTVYSSKQERLISFKTLSGIPIEPIYTPLDVADLDYLQHLGFPGEEPFVRGVHSNMYRGRTWTRRQLAGFGPAEETNKRYKFLLDAGADGINGVFDYPTLRGYDSTDPLAYADAGRGGVAIDTILRLQMAANSHDKIRIVLARLGMDAHWRGSIVVARALRDAGMEVIYLGNQMPEVIVKTAVDEDVNVVGLSSLSGNHMVLAPQVAKMLRDAGLSRTTIILGGTVLPDEVPGLKALGIAEVFGPGSSLSSIVDLVRNECAVKSDDYKTIGDGSR